MKILVIKFRNIGDVLLTTPLIKNLKLNYPAAQIDVVVNKGTEAMLYNNPNITDIYTYDRTYYKSLPKIKRFFKELKFIRQFKDYDIVINTTEGDRGAFIAKFSNAKIKIGYPVKKNLYLKNAFTRNLKMDWDKHIIQNNLDAIQALHQPIHQKQVEIFWSKDDQQRVDALNMGEFVHIHPVSRWLFKCIDDELMAKIIDFVSQKYQVVITASNDTKEKQKVANILALTESKPINLSGELSLSEVAYLSSKAKLFIGVDTAIMHIAAAVNTPVVAFFGPSFANNWGPWDNHTQQGYKYKKGIQQNGKHVVIQNNWDCIPCGIDGCNGSKISECLMRFDEDIFKYIRDRL
ncbi:MAG: putative lipopolysaccharide heptosyltransferase III [Epsilonproteobacteria bacterium]|nr:putative lipopolysaccharide heptosyltransferase III [Campylobacterota bacterium]